jgi:aerobic-type carbon monoxide dehydrogenase small subunit (CoxS/CutS family)
MSVTAARRSGASAATTEGEVLGGHVCRCTGYLGIRAAIRKCWTVADDATDVTPRDGAPDTEGASI